MNMILIFGLFLSVFYSTAVAFDSKIDSLAFPHKLIFSETPSIGRLWRGGIRMHDILIWDCYLNVNNWFLIDLLYAGLSKFNLKEEQLMLTDNFSVLSIKSKPILRKQIASGLYDAAVGTKFYSARFYIEEPSDTIISSFDKSVAFFISQRYSWTSGNYLNGFFSLSASDKYVSSGVKKVSLTLYAVGAYRLAFSRHWNFAIEYFLTNTEKLPIKFLQWAIYGNILDEFSNPGRNFYSFMIWGVQYCRKHIQISLTSANHITFLGGIVPLIGIGWNF